MTPEAEKELAEIRARSAARAAARAAKQEADAVTRELNAARLQEANEVAIENAIDQHGEIGLAIAVVETTVGVVIVKSPERLRWKQFVAKAAKLTDEDTDLLVRTCLVHPSKDAYGALVDKHPAIPTRCAEAIVMLAGAQSAESAKK